MYNQKLSILIPTRNRQEYAIKCIKSILNFGIGDYEIVVQDNSDYPSLKDTIVELDDDHVVYHYCNDALSFCQNFENAVLNSSGDYLIAIGDDDCVLPAIFELTNIVRQKGLKAVLYSLDSTYKWPNSIGDNKGILVIRRNIPKIKTLSTKNAIFKMVNSGNFDYQKFNFPKIYHGLVSRELLDKVYKQTGHYFSGLTPDIYSAVALSYFVDEVLYINYPFSLPGICKRSGTADSLSGRHTGSLKDAPHFRGNPNYEWEPAVPYIYSVQSIWAETALKAIRDCGESFEFSKKQYYNFMRTTLFQCPTLKQEIIDDYCNRYGGSKTWLYIIFSISTFTLKIKRLVKKSISFIKQLIIGRKTYKGMESIDLAVEKIATELKDYPKLYEKIRNL